jgi:hypothetical protein
MSTEGKLNIESSRLLKPPSTTLKPFVGCSNDLVTSTVPSGLDPRGYYLKDFTSSPPPVTSSSPFVPRILIEHLMRRKKNSALAVKFRALSGTDEITNMEGAMHTFVTPICLAYLHGDYKYRGGHGIVHFPDVEVNGKMMQQARQVVISASVQPDFEGKHVMLRACALEDSAVEGTPLPKDFKIMDVKDKQIDEKRNAYDIMLRAHMIYHLTKAGCLPGLSQADLNIFDVLMAINLFTEQITAEEIDYSKIQEMFVRLPGGAVISLEILFNSAVQQLRNEISALEVLCPQGYVYTIDPPSIFAQEIGQTLLNRIQVAALKWLAQGEDGFKNMEMVAFNDYADPYALKLLSTALRNRGYIMVAPKIHMFPGPVGVYNPSPSGGESLLVVHNNSGMYLFHKRLL